MIMSFLFPGVLADANMDFISMSETGSLGDFIGLMGIEKVLN